MVCKGKKTDIKFQELTREKNTRIGCMLTFFVCLFIFLLSLNAFYAIYMYGKLRIDFFLELRSLVYYH